MPRLVKGGKYVFGIARVYENYQMHIPPEALEEYKLFDEQAVILISGSETSGGFSICSIKKLKQSRLSELLKFLKYDDQKGIFNSEEGKIYFFKKRAVSWIKLNKNGSFRLSQEQVEQLNLKSCLRLVVARGSGLGVGFIAKGPIFEEAAKHSELNIF